MSDHQAAQWPIHSWHTHAAAASDQTTHHHHLEAVDDEPQQQSPTACKWRSPPFATFGAL